MKIFEISEQPDLIDTSIDYFWKQWGNDSNFNFYADCIRHSMNHEKQLPKFYIGIENDQIIGSYALLTNDIISRQDLMPWFACLYVDESCRNKGYGGQLLQHGLQQANLKGFKNLYLSTDLQNFYERKGWTTYGVGYNVFGDEIKIYCKSTQVNPIT